MIFLRAIIFIVTLAFGFIYSGSLDGIEKIREGGTDLAASIISSFQEPEITEGAEIVIDLEKEPSVVATYATPTTAKILLIAIGLFCAIFMATLPGAGALGLLGGVLFSPDIASVPVLADAAVSISSTVSALWADFIAKMAER